MLAAYFDIPAKDAGEQPGRRADFGRAKGKAKGVCRARKPPRPTESSATTVHAKFVPLPPERNIPQPAEEPGQAWQGLDPATTRDDDVVAWDAWGEDEEDPAGSEDEEASEPDFEPESLELDESLGSSVEDIDVHAMFGMRARGGRSIEQSVAVYSGPQLCFEDEDFDD